MSERSYDELKKVVGIRQAMTEYQDMAYLNLIQQVNTKCKEILTDDMGSQFVRNCGRDLAGEITRNYFDTSEYYLTADQLFRRILNFNYENEYDPFSKGGEIQKNTYNYNDIISARLDGIVSDLDNSQAELFPKTDKTYEDSSLMQKGKREYVTSKTREDGTIIDEYTGEEGEYITDKNGNRRRRLEVDHIQAAHTARYNKDLISENGIEELKQMMNSADNFAMMDKIANGSKGDVSVYEKDGHTLTQKEAVNYKREIKEQLKEAGKDSSDEAVRKVFSDNVIDITHRATPEQLAKAVCERWEGTSGETRQELINKGYLNEDGSVPKSVRNKLVANLKHSQNVESKVILKNIEYDKAGQKAFDSTFRKRNEDGTYGKFSLDSAFGKIIAGQFLYYALPPVVYEVKSIIKNKTVNLDNALDQLFAAGTRIGNYVFSKLKAIFTNIAFNTLKNLIKSFMDILIQMVKATVKKMLKLVKNLVLASVDAVRIITDPNSTGAEKADSVVNLFGITITNFAVEVLFEFLQRGLNLPDFICNPLRMITTVICTNLTMLVLQKADLFDVRFGFKMRSINNMFTEMRNEYKQECEMAGTYADSMISAMILQAREDGKEIYSRLMELDATTHSVEGELNRINKMFSMDIDFDAEWLRFVNLPTIA